MKKQYELQIKLDDILDELDTYKDLVLQDENIEYVGEQEYEYLCTENYLCL